MAESKIAGKFHLESRSLLETINKRDWVCLMAEKGKEHSRSGRWLLQLKERHERGFESSSSSVQKRDVPISCIMHETESEWLMDRVSLFLGRNF